MLYVENLLVETCVQNLVIRGPLVTKLPQNTKYTNRPKFVDPRLAAVSGYRPSVCLSSVTLVHPTQPVDIFGNFSTPFGTLAIC